MSIFSAIEDDILDELYFVVAYADLGREVDADQSDVTTHLSALLKKGYVQQLVFDEAIKDFVKRPDTDFQHLDKYHYVASKEGLLAHNSKG